MISSHKLKYYGLGIFLVLTALTQLPANLSAEIGNGSGGSWSYGQDRSDLCGDLLEIYAHKPAGLSFDKCEIKSGQVLVEATYSVSGKESKAVEDFLVEFYHMGKLRWVCCGWESQAGGFNHKTLLQIDPYLSGSVSMYGSGEVFDPNDPEKYIGLEANREEIPYFYVTVELVRV